MRGLLRLLGLGLLLGAMTLYVMFVLDGANEGPEAAPDEEGALRILEAPPVSTPTPAIPVRLPAQDSVLMEAARRAWSYWGEFERPETGLVASVAWYDYATVWDLGSTVAALHSAHALGLVEDDAYRTRMGALLERIASLRRVDGGALNKFYKTDTGQPSDREGAPSLTGYGWSAVDLGRLLVWLRIVAEEDPTFAATARRAVARLDLGELTRDGFLWGGSGRTGGGWVRFMEGRLGYEQYASRGYTLWGHEPKEAEAPGPYARSAEVLGVPLLNDDRPRSCLTSEPFLLWGLELGAPAWADSLTSRLLDAQEARYERTGRPTLLSEDAITVAPDYFYYSCVLSGASSFVVLTPEYELAPDAPRTVSAKAAFGWYALRPSAYTRKMLTDILTHAVQDGRWVAGVTEDGLEPIGAPNINTVAVILESILYLRGKVPLIERVRTARDSLF